MGPSVAILRLILLLWLCAASRRAEDVQQHEATPSQPIPATACSAGTSKAECVCVDGKSAACSAAASPAAEPPSPVPPANNTVHDTGHARQQQQHDQTAAHGKDLDSAAVGTDSVAPLASTPGLAQDVALEETTEAEAAEAEHAEELKDFARLKDGAKVLAANREARKPQALLDDDPDTFLRNDCKASKWVVVELSQVAKISRVALAQYELYSSRVRDFELRGRQSHPRTDGLGSDYARGLNSTQWRLLGNFTAEKAKGVQSFIIEQPAWVRFVLIRFLTHYGTEPVCAINALSLYGKSAAEEFEDQLARDAEADLSLLEQPEEAGDAEAGAEAGSAEPSGSGDAVREGQEGGAAAAGESAAQQKHEAAEQSEERRQAADKSEKQRPAQEAAADGELAAGGSEAANATDNAGGSVPVTAAENSTAAAPAAEQANGSADAADAAIAAKHSRPDAEVDCGTDAHSTQGTEASVPAAVHAKADTTAMPAESSPKRRPASSTSTPDGSQELEQRQQQQQQPQQQSPQLKVAPNGTNAPWPQQQQKQQQQQQQKIGGVTPEKPIPPKRPYPGTTSSGGGSNGGNGAVGEAQAAAASNLDDLPLGAAKAKGGGASLYELLVQEIKGARVQQKLLAKAVAELARNASTQYAVVVADVAALTAELARVHREANLSEEAVALRVDALVKGHLVQMSSELAALRASMAGAAKREHALLSLLAMLGAIVALGSGRFASQWPRARWVVLALALANGAVGMLLQLASGVPSRPHARLALPGWSGGA